MARRSSKRPYASAHRPLDMTRLSSMPRSIERRGETYQVQYLSSATKTYVCPACPAPISPGSAHVVVWRTEGAFGRDIGVGSRRHWHPDCWERDLGRNYGY
ncbi:MAG: ATP/GTP-binding protein [Actinomycetaceae bacterium]|nr:ATP/GTP-binding protein [Actinomycetaceae bacterium]